MAEITLVTAVWRALSVEANLPGTNVMQTPSPKMPDYLTLPIGSTLSGNIAGREQRQPGGGFILRTAKGDLVLKTDLPLTVGAKVELIVEGSGQQFQARIATVDGKPVEAIRAAAGAPQGQQSGGFSQSATIVDHEPPPDIPLSVYRRPLASDGAQAAPERQGQPLFVRLEVAQANAGLLTTLAEAADAPVQALLNLFARGNAVQARLIPQTAPFPLPEGAVPPPAPGASAPPASGTPSAPVPAGVPVAGHPVAGTPVAGNPVATAPAGAPQTGMPQAGAPPAGLPLPPASTPAAGGPLSAMPSFAPQAAGPVMAGASPPPAAATQAAPSHVAGSAPPAASFPAAAPSQPAVPLPPASLAALPPLPAGQGAAPPSAVPNPVTPVPGAPPPSPNVQAAAAQSAPVQLLPDRLIASASLIPPAGSQPAMLQSPAGVFVLPPSFALPASPNATYRLEVSLHAPVAQPPAAPQAERREDPRLTRLQAIDQLLHSMKTVEPSFHPLMLERLPQPNQKLTSGLIFMLSALTSGNIRKLFGDAAVDILEHAGFDEALRKAVQELGSLSQPVQDKAGFTWQSYAFPLYEHEQFQPLYLFVRKDGGQEGAAASTEDGARFIFELELSALGNLQFDGFYRKQAAQRHFDLAVRSADTLPDPVRADIIRLFEDGLAVTGMKGALSFHLTRDFLTHLLDESPAPPPRPDTFFA